MRTVYDTGESTVSSRWINGLALAVHDAEHGASSTGHTHDVHRLIKGVADPKPTESVPGRSRD